MGTRKSREVMRPGRTAFNQTTDQSNHLAAVEIARRERSLAVRQVREESEALAVAERHELFGRLTSKLGSNVLETQARLEAMAKSQGDIVALRPLAQSYLQLTVEAHQHHGRRLLG